MIFDKIDNELTRGRGAEPDPVTVTDMFKVSERSMREREAFNSVDQLIEEEIDKVNEDVKRATGQEIINPVRNPYYRGQLSPNGDMTETDGGAALNPLVERYAQSSRLRRRVDPYQDYRQQIEELRSKFPDALDWADLNDRPFRETTRRARSAKAEADELQARSGLVQPQDIPLIGKVPLLSDVSAGVYNIFTSPGLMAGQMAGSIYGSRHSPVDIGMNVIPGLAGTRAASLLRNAIRNGMTNAAAQAALEPFISENYERTGDKRTWEETYAAIAGAFGIGAALDLSIRTPGRYIAKASGAPGPYGGFFTSVDEVPSISRDTAARAAAGDPDALREVTRALGVDQDPAVKGAIDHLDTVGKVDAEAERAAQLMGIDNVSALEQFDKMARAATDPEQAAVMRAPEPAIEARIKSEPDAALDLMQRSPGALDALMGGIEARLNQIDARLPQMVQDAFEAGFGDVLPVVREAVDKIEAGSPPDKVANDIAVSITKLAEDPTFALRVALHSGRASPLEMARIMRERPDVVEASGLPASGALEARALAAMDDAAFELVSRGDASLGAALAVADTVPMALQADLLGKLAEVKVTDPDMARRMIPDMLPPDVATKAALLGVDQDALPKRQAGLVDDVEPGGKGAKAQTERLEQALAPNIEEARAANAQPQPDPKTVREALERNADVRSAIETALGVIGDAARRKALEDRAKRILPEGIDVMVTDAPLVDPVSGRLLDAVSDTTTGMIQLSTRALNPMARLGHEAGHTLVTLGLIDPRELAAMADAAIRDGVFGPEMADAYRATYSARTKADGTPLNDPAKVERMVQEEAAMHYVEAVDKGTVGQTAPERTLAQKVLDFMRRLAVEFGVRNLRTPDEIARALLDGEMAERAAVKAWMREQDITALAVKPEMMAALGDDKAPRPGPRGSGPQGRSNEASLAETSQRLSDMDPRRQADAVASALGQALGREFEVKPGGSAAGQSAYVSTPIGDLRFSDHAAGMRPGQARDYYGTSDTVGDVVTYVRSGMEDTVNRLLSEPAPVRQSWMTAKDWKEARQRHENARPNWMTADEWKAFKANGSTDTMFALSDLDMSPEAKKQRATFDPSKSDSPILMFAFAGERARTADLDALTKAKAMDSDGIDRTRIWTDTGWFRGVDGKWRFEIDDSHVSLKDTGRHTIAESGKYEFAVVEGRHSPDSFQIDGSDLGDRTGIGGGTSLYHALINDALENGKIVYSDGSVSPSAQRIYEGLKSRGYDVTQNEATRLTGGSLMGKAISLSKPIQPVYTIRPFADRNDANAVLARTTMARISMTPEQRRARPPWEDYDVPEKDQIVRFAGGDSQAMFALRDPRGVSQMSYSAEPPIDGPAMQGLAMFAIRAYHGSPHDFDKFDMSRIGTGEGAQAYGHGLYFAENEGVAKSYKSKLSDTSLPGYDPANYLHVADRHLAQSNGDKASAISNLSEIAERYRSDMPAVAKRYERAAKAIQNDEPLPGLAKSSGRLYEVNIRAEPDDFLDWDKPLSQQSEKVRSVLNEKFDAEDVLSPDDYIGDLIEGDLKDASITNQLRDAGIAGIRYLDQGSRDAGEGSRNYVVFDDSLIEITAKDGQPVTPDDKAEIVAGMTKRVTGGSMFALRDDQPQTQPTPDLPAIASRMMEMINPYLDAARSAEAQQLMGMVERDGDGNITSVINDGKRYTITRNAAGDITGIAESEAPTSPLNLSIVRGEDGLAAQVEANGQTYKIDRDGAGSIAGLAQSQLSDLAAQEATVRQGLAGIIAQTADAYGGKLAPERAEQIAGEALDIARAAPADPISALNAVTELVNRTAAEMASPEPARAANDNVPTPLQADLRDMDRMMMALDFVGVCRL